MIAQRRAKESWPGVVQVTTAQVVVHRPPLVYLFLIQPRIHITQSAPLTVLTHFYFIFTCHNNYFPHLLLQTHTSLSLHHNVYLGVLCADNDSYNKRRMMGGVCGGCYIKCGLATTFVNTKLWFELHLLQTVTNGQLIVIKSHEMGQRPGLDIVVELVI